MDMTSLIYYTVGACIVIVILVVGCNLIVNVLIKQYTDRALHHFQQRLSHLVVAALDGFKEGVCEQIAAQEKKSDSLAKLYSSLIDLQRDGKEFSASYCRDDLSILPKKMLGFEETAKAFGEQYRKQSLHFGNDFKQVMDGFATELEALCEFFRLHWNSVGKNRREKNDGDQEQIRQAWAKADDRLMTIMELTRNEFRKRIQSPESVMKKWLNEVPIHKTEPAAKAGKSPPHPQSIS